MFDALSLMMSNTYAEPGLTYGAPRVIGSVVKKSANNNLVSNFDGGFNLLGDLSELKVILKSYPLTKLMLGIISTTVKDIVNKSPFEVSLSEGDIKIQNSINNYLNAINIKSIVLNNLDDILYEGSYGAYVKSYRNRVTNDYNYIVREFMSPTNLIAAYYRNKLKCFIFDKTSFQPIKDDRQFKAEEVLWISFYPKSIKKVSTHTNNNEKESLLVDIEYKKGTGILDDILPLLYEHMLKYWMKLLLSLKDTLRPDLLMARMSDKASDIARATDIIQNIEAALNNNESSITFGYTNPLAIINLIQSSVLNSTKVVPGIQNFTDFELLNYPDIQSKLEKLTNDLDSLKKSIGNQVGIPEELLEGSSNRWEVISRSSRFLTVVNSVLTSISESVKEIASQHVKNRFGKDYSVSNISLILDTTNVIFNTELNSRVELISNKVSSISRLLSDFESILNNGLIGDKSKLIIWFKNQLEVLDPELPDILVNNVSDNQEEEITKEDNPW